MRELTSTLFLNANNQVHFSNVSCNHKEPRFNPVVGVIPIDLLSINRILELKGWFSIAQYNETLDRFKFTSYERNDKPYPLPSSKSVKKLRGKAVSNWGSHLYICIKILNVIEIFLRMEIWKLIKIFYYSKCIASYMRWLL